MTCELIPLDKPQRTTRKYIKKVLYPPGVKRGYTLRPKTEYKPEPTNIFKWWQDITELIKTIRFKGEEYDD